MELFTVEIILEMGGIKVLKENCTKSGAYVGWGPATGEWILKYKLDLLHNFAQDWCEDDNPCKKLPGVVVCKQTVNHTAEKSF